MTRSRSPRPTVLGLDLSLTSAGWATGTHHHGIICPPDAWKPMERRWAYLRDGVLDVIDDSVERGRPVVAAFIERIMDHGAGQSGDRHPAGFHAAVRVALLDAGIPTATVHNQTLKVYGAGNGHATKDDMARSLRHFGGPWLPGMHDQVDAIWCHAYGMQAAGTPVFELPPTHTRALDKAAWPVAP